MLGGDRGGFPDPAPTPTLSPGNHRPEVQRSAEGGRAEQGLGRWRWRRGHEKIFSFPDSSVIGLSFGAGRVLTYERQWPGMSGERTAWRWPASGAAARRRPLKRNAGIARERGENGEGEGGRKRGANGVAEASRPTQSRVGSAVVLVSTTNDSRGTNTGFLKQCGVCVFGGRRGRRGRPRR